MDNMRKQSQIDLDKIKKIRLQNNMTQTYISEKLGYKSASGYSNIENGRRELSFENAIKIAGILGVNINDFLRH